MAKEEHEIVATDIQVRFRSIVLLPIEWAIAAIPAMIVVYVIAIAVSVALDPVLAPVPHWSTARSTSGVSQVDFAPLVANH